MDNVLLIATMDTKSREALYFKACFKEASIPVLVLDAGIKGESPVPVGINREKVAGAGMWNKNGKNQHANQRS